MRLVLRTTTAVLLLTFGLFGQPPAADEQSFRQFLKWLSARPPTSRPTDLVPPYRQELIKQGLSEQEADRQLAELWQRAYKDPEGSRMDLIHPTKRFESPGKTPRPRARR